MDLHFSWRKKSRLAKKAFLIFKLETRKLKPLYARLRPKNPSVSSTACQLSFTDWTKAVGVASYLKRVFKKKKPKTVAITVAERRDTEMLTFKELQSTAFKNEIISLSHKEQNAQLPKQSSLLKLDPFVDEQGLIRVDGILENSTLPFHVEHSIILPRRSQVT